MPEFKGNLYFSFTNRANNNSNELWRTNGTTNNASYFSSLGISSSMLPIAALNGKLLFLGFTSTNGLEIFTTDSAKNSETL